MYVFESLFSGQLGHVRILVFFIIYILLSSQCKFQLMEIHCKCEIIEFLYMHPDPTFLIYWSGYVFYNY